MHGQALGPARVCQACHELHPVGTTCAAGWAPWNGTPAVDDRLVMVLDADELQIGQECGEARLADSKRKKLKDKLGVDAEWKHVTGAQGEVAFAKWREIPFKCSIGAHHGAADVGGCQVKTRRKTSYELTVHEEDPDNIPCVLVTAHPPRFWIRGWYFAGEARQHKKWYRDLSGKGWWAWVVPTHELRPMDTLMTNPRARAGMGLPPEGV